MMFSKKSFNECCKSIVRSNFTRNYFKYNGKSYDKLQSISHKSVAAFAAFAAFQFYDFQFLTSGTVKLSEKILIDFAIFPAFVVAIVFFFFSPSPLLIFAYKNHPVMFSEMFASSTVNLLRMLKGE